MNRQPDGGSCDGEQPAEPERREGVTSQALDAIVHDLKNLVTIILGHSDSLLSRVQLDDPAFPDLTAILQAAERAVSLLQRLGPAVAPAPERTPDPGVAIAGINTVLIVDDEPDIRTLIRRALEPYCANILEAGNAGDALAEAAVCDEKIGLAIVDFLIPGLSGLDLALQLERGQPGMRTLYMSAAVESVAIAGLLRNAPERVLVKPFTAEQLLDRVKVLARARR